MTFYSSSGWWPPATLITGLIPITQAPSSSRSLWHHHVMIMQLHGGNMRIFNFIFCLKYQLDDPDHMILAVWWKLCSKQLKCITGGLNKDSLDSGKAHHALGITQSYQLDYLHFQARVEYSRAIWFVCLSTAEIWLRPRQKWFQNWILRFLLLWPWPAVAGRRQIRGTIEAFTSLE